MAGHFNLFDPYRLVNPAAANVYYNTSGTAAGASSTSLNKGRAVGLTSSVSAGFTKVALGDRGRPHYGSKVVGGIGAGAAMWSTSAAVSLTSVAASGGFARYTKTSHGRSVGDIINVTDTNSVVNGPQRITAVPTANTFDTDMPYTSGAGTMTYLLSRGNFATMTAGTYVMRKVATTLAGQSNTVLRSGASDFGVRRSIHKLEHMRTYRVATAIRAGYWNEYNGTWSTAPTSADDASTMGTDHAATPTLAVPGELVYRSGKPLPVQEDYDAKTVG